jgi:demethylmenaquinone methyltransferase/2-methoxy-6-polyprenyl-1,4-benzoquinol methylase
MRRADERLPASEGSNDPASTDPRMLRAMDLEAHLADASIKQLFVTPMFDVVAPRYDRFTRRFSFGMDRGWKRELLAGVDGAVPPGAVVLDLACGTGDLALEIAQRIPGARVTGVDASRAMIDMAERRRLAVPGGRVRFEVGDMAHLNAASASVDLVTAGYALRNAADFRRVIAEIDRVLNPGGMLLTLDFYRPENPIWRSLFVTYLRLAGALVGWLWHRVPVVYAYLGPSVSHFVSWQEFSRTLEGAGFEVLEARPKLLGGIAIHRARKRGHEETGSTSRDDRLSR